MSNDRTVTTKRGSTAELQSMLVLSTGHVTKATADALNLPLKDADRLSWAPQLTWEYGWIWYVDRGTFDLVDFPPEFEAIFKLAVALDCLWVRFDCDADKIEELPFYDW